MVPLLTGRLQLSQHRAHGTSLAIIMFVAVSGVAGYWRAGNIDWRLVLALVPGAVVGVYAGARTMVKVPALQLRLLFGAFLFFVAFRQLVWHVSAGAPQEGAAGLLMRRRVRVRGRRARGRAGRRRRRDLRAGHRHLRARPRDAGEDPQKVAQGVSLVVIVCTGALGTVDEPAAGDDRRARRCAGWCPLAIVAAFVGVVLANRLDAERAEDASTG